METSLRYVTVARDDDLYNAFPDICLLPSGTLVCIYREADQHVASTSRLMLVESEDRGHTWTQPRQLDARRSFAEDRSTWNNPRIVRLHDGRLVVNCDASIYPEQADSWRWPENQR